MYEVCWSGYGRGEEREDFWTLFWILPCRVSKMVVGQIIYVYPSHSTSPDLSSFLLCTKMAMFYT